MCVGKPLPPPPPPPHPPAALADYYERAILNDVIGIQHLPPDPANPHLHSHSHPHPHPHPHTHRHALPGARGGAASAAGHMHPAPARLPDVGMLAAGGAGAVDAAAMAAAYAAQPRPDNYQVWCGLPMPAATVACFPTLPGRTHHQTLVGKSY